MRKITARLINQLAVGGVVAGLLLLLLAYVIIVRGLASHERSNEAVDHTYEVKDQLTQLMLQIERAEAARRGYILRPDPGRAAVYQAASSQVMPRLDRVTTLVSDNPEQRENIAELRPLILSELGQLDASMDLALAGRIAEAHERFTYIVGFRTLTRVREVVDEMRAEEDRLLAQRDATEAANLRWLQISLALTGLLILMVSVGTILLMRRFIRDLTQSRDELRQLNENLEEMVASRTIELQRANAEIQRFAYIVSHDLRSPLVNIMGFTSELERATRDVVRLIDRLEEEHPGFPTKDELFAVREDLPEATGFIRLATEKMDRLINSILHLSREGRRVLTAEHLPMERLLSDLGATLESQLAAKDATLIIDPGVPDLNHDRVAIEQIFSNLLDNAVKYLKPGVPGEIHVSGRRERRRAIFEVSDNGRGIDERDHHRVFDLFRRSGQQDQPGEGIGLAHVRSLIHRLGGTIDLRSSLGEGSTFIVTLPVHYQKGAE